MILVGTSVKTGEFNGNNYHNVVFFGIIPAQGKNVTGQHVEIVKAKYSVVVRSLRISEEEFKDLLGKEIWFSYDKFGAVEHISVIEQTEQAVGA
ncbi:MAG: hypothetical protein FWG70_01070 [Oscillospiraceae bacterium]|nr:hypothetical protein [Oscillospiraceae bacterium]